MNEMRQQRAMAGLWWIFLALTAAGLAASWSWYLTRPAAPPPEPAASAIQPAPPVPPPATPPETVWRVFAAPAVPGGVGDELTDIRLAGTFFWQSDDPGAPPQRKAILDLIAEKTQCMVGEGDEIPPYRVRAIENDAVRLERDGRELRLTLSFTDAAAGPEGAADGGAATAATEPDFDDEPALETNRFGKRIAENRWVVRRDAMMDYYRELLEEPERVVRLYATFKPDYDEDRKIAGYRLGIEGEKDFLDAMGLREGDAVRMVNSMRMTSQSRAEYFIGEFVKERLGAVVLDIERDGRPQKLIYLLR